MGIRIYSNSFSNPEYYSYSYSLKVDSTNNIRIRIRVKIIIRDNTDMNVFNGRILNVTYFLVRVVDLLKTSSMTVDYVLMMSTFLRDCNLFITVVFMSI